tara:strand:+ start:9032 stop:9208 length:177 start_codon:yes stop_codon:yes gene_type:complete
MTVETFHDKFISNFKLETKEVVEYINELEACIYEKNKALTILEKEHDELQCRLDGLEK